MELTVERLRKAYNGDFELHIPSLHIASGEAFGLVGNNGAGKTTFLRLILDLLPADEGVVRLGNHRVSQSTEWKKHTGIFLDTNFLIDFLTPDEYIAFVATTYDVPIDVQEEYLSTFADFFTDPVFNQSARRIRDLSTGNAKKVGILAALLVQPSVLILDEPFANLDPRSQLQLISYFDQENKERGTTLLISSHDLIHVTEVCDRIAVLDEGQIVRDESTTPETVKSLQTFFSAGEAHEKAPQTPTPKAGSAATPETPR